MNDGHETLRSTIETLFAQQVESLTASVEFHALEDGSAEPDRYDAFVENVARAHLRSPQLLAFLYALAPPAAEADLRHNLLGRVMRQPRNDASASIVKDDRRRTGDRFAATTPAR
jgi:hypothetical protein